MPSRTSPPWRSTAIAVWNLANSLEPNQHVEPSIGRGRGGRARSMSVCSAEDPFLDPVMLEQAFADERVVSDELVGVRRGTGAEGDQSS
jgi:hypothetical protein